MSEQRLMTISELGNFFEINGNLYTNPNGIEIELTDTFSASVQIWSKEPVKFSLHAEFPDTHLELSQKMNLHTDADIDRIDEAELWEHYAVGNGYVWADLDELLDTPLEFSVVGGKTRIKTYNHNYKDEVDEVWDNVTAFRDYVRNNIKKIYIAVEQKAEKV